MPETVELSPALCQTEEYDLHTHSTYSDGTETPEQIADQARLAGLRGFALTDHDTTAGWDEARAACAAQGLEFLPGMEITTKLAGYSTHLLAYGFDDHNEALTTELDRVRESRLGRAQEMVRLLSEDFRISWNDVYSGDTEKTVGRPHIADALVRNGYFVSRDAAFRTVLSAQSPYYVHTYAIDTEHAVRLVLEAGGVTVLAHPAAARNLAAISDENLTKLVNAGLWGIELRHPENVSQRLPALYDAAMRLSLQVTGSSDYHGSGKANRLGECRTDATTWRQLLSAVSHQA